MVSNYLTARKFPRRAIRYWIYTRKIRSQLLIAFVLFILFAIGCTLCVCLKISYSTSNEAYNHASDSIDSENIQRIQTTSRILSEATADTLQVFGDYALSSAIFAFLILNPKQDSLKNQATLPSPMLVSDNIYREYNFIPGCQYPKCPRDYGPLQGRSRASKLSNTNGSMEHSSIHLFSSSAKAARNDCAWNSIVSTDSNIKRVMDALGIFDDESNIMYHRAINISSMIYISVSIKYSTGAYVNIHRSYPGVQKNSSNFDLWKRDWFAEAPVDAVHVQGPFASFFSKDPIFSISSKKEIVLAGNTKIVIVSMVDSLLTAFEEIIHGMQYPDEGFGAVIKADGSNQVIVWKQGFAVYDQTTGSQGSFKSVHDFDPNLASHDLTQNRVIKYTDSAGDVWLVSCTPFFDNSSYSNPNKKEAFVILVWVKYSVASASLQDLKHRTDHSASSILLYDLIVTFAIGLAVYVIVSLTSLRLHLIDSIIAVARQLIRLQGQEEADRDYTDVCNAADRLRETQQDELGLLAIEFSSVVSMLKEENEARLSRQLYPANPFYWPGTWSDCSESDLASSPPSVWSNIINHFCSNGFILTESLNSVPDQPAIPTNPFRSLLIAKSAKVEPENLAVIINDVDHHNEAPTAQEQHSVHWVLSFKTPLYLAVALLIAGIAACLLLTVLYIKSSGKSWMKNTSDNIQAQTIENLRVITSAKSTVIKLFFQKLTVQTMLGANYTTKLMAGNLALPHWNREGGHLQSYSVDPYNNYWCPFKSNRFSGYYMKVSVESAVQTFVFSP